MSPAAQGPLTLDFQNGLRGFSGNEDTYLAEGSGNSNYGNDIEILADGDDRSRDELITLLKWNISAIPDTATTVTSASITLRVFNRSKKVYNHWEPLTGWSKSSATWNNVNPLAYRGDKVGNFTPSSSGTYTIDLKAGGLALIQNWIDGSAVNDGISLQSGGTSDGVDIRSSEYSTQSQRPKLTITYQDEHREPVVAHSIHKGCAATFH